MYTKDVVDKAIEGLRQGGMPYPEVFRVLLERVYDCGYNEAQRVTYDKFEFSDFIRCRVCGIRGDGTAYAHGYVRNQSDCPTRSTCSS